MTFAVAALIVVGLAAVFLGLLAYHLVARLDSIEQAVYGGMRAPSHQLRREEFGRRFVAAKHRAEFARRFDTAVVLFVDPDSDTSKEILATVSAMSQRRNLVVASGDDRTAPVVPADVESLRIARHALTEMAIAALPFCLVIDEGVVVDGRPVGSTDAISAMLLEVA